MNIRSRKLTATLALVGTSFAFLTGTNAWAQASTASQPVQTLEKFEVTGSRLTPPDFEAALPVNTYTAQAISLGTAESVNNFLRFMPSAFGSGNYDESFVNGGDGRAFIGLRGLPTLTLINGRRSATGDLNLVPMSAVDRIDILKDGNGAVYGADAVGGVINIVTKKKFEGVSFDASYQNTTKNDISRRRFEMVYGNSGPKSNVVLGIAFFEQHDLFSKDRNEVTETNDRSFGATSGTPNPGQFNLTAAEAARLFGATTAGQYRVKNDVVAAASPSDFRIGIYGNVPAAQSDRFPYALYTPAVRPAKRYNVYSSVDYSIFDKTLKIYADVFYMRGYSQAGLAPSPAGFRAATPVGSANDFRIPANNYWVQRVFGAARATDITNWNYRFVDFGPRLIDTKFDDFALTTGFKGEITERIGYDFSYLWNRNEQLEIERAGVNRARLQEVLRGGSEFTGARSFNPFTNPFDSGKVSQDPDMLNYIKLEPRTTREYTTTVLNFTLNAKPFDLSAGPVEVVGGWEKRIEDFVRTPDLAKQQAAGSGWNSTTAETTKYDVKSLFAEGVVPVLADAPFTKKLQLGAAIRNETFSHLKKKATVGRVYFRDQFTKELTGRLSYSEGYTAPTVLNLTEKPAQNFPQIFMPWLGVAEQPSEGTLEGGNANLKPTRSESYNVGLVWSPRALKGFSASVDVYKVKRSDIIVRDAQLYVDVFNKAGGLTRLANGNYSKNASAPFADRIDVDLDGRVTGTKGSLIQISPVPYENIASLDAKGVDLELTYSLPTRDIGNFSWRLNVTRVQNFSMIKIAGLTATDYEGVFTPNDSIGPVTVPQWRGNFDTIWDWKNYSALVKLNYTHHYSEDPDGGDKFTATVASWPTWDFTVGYKFQKWGNTTLRAGLENVFNRMPPRASSSFADKYDRSMHNILGRMWTVKLNQRF